MTDAKYGSDLMLGGFKIESFPSVSSLVSEIWIPALDTSLLTFKLRVYRSECQSEWLDGQQKHLSQLNILGSRFQSDALRAIPSPVLASCPGDQVFPERPRSHIVHALVWPISASASFTLRWIRLANTIYPRSYLFEVKQWQRSSRHRSRDQARPMGDSWQSYDAIPDGCSFVPDCPCSHHLRDPAQEI